MRPRRRRQVRQPGGDGGAGFGVPPAFAVTTAAYRGFMRESGLEERARAVRATAAGGIWRP